MRSIFVAILFLTACIKHQPAHFMTVTVTAAEATCEKDSESWYLLRLEGIDNLASFRKEKQHGSMRIEDFFEAWDLERPLDERLENGRLSFALTLKVKTLPIRIQKVQYDPLVEELTLMIQPLDLRENLPTRMHGVELIFIIDVEDQLFWNKWMGL